MWPFPTRPPRTVGKTLRGAAAGPWLDVEVPEKFHEGVPDSGRAGVFMVPSPYDIPEATREAYSAEGWAIQWRYLGGGEDMRWTRHGTIWLGTGRHSKRLLAVAGESPRDESLLDEAMAAWLRTDGDGPDFHREIMDYLWAARRARQPVAG